MTIKKSANFLVRIWLIFLFTGFALSFQDKEIVFNVQIDCHTPVNETVCVYIESLEGTGSTVVFPMNKVSEKQWKVTIDSVWFFSGQTVKYKYCRNGEFGAADESFGAKNKQGYREVTLATQSAEVQDNVSKWRWWPEDGIVPQIDESSHLTKHPNYLPRKSFMCGVMFIDWWNTRWLSSVGPTCDEIKKNTNADWVQYPPVAEITQFYPTPVIDREGNNGTPDADLISIIEEAHKRGLKVYLNPTAFALLVEDPFPTNHDKAWWQAYYKAWKKDMLYYAKLARDLNVEMLGFSMWPVIESISQQEVQNVDPLAQKLLKEVRAIYKNPICVMYNHMGVEMQVFGKGDYLGTNIWSFWPYNTNLSKNPTVAEMARYAKLNLDDLYKGQKKWKKPIVLDQIAAYTYNGAAAGLCDDPESLGPEFPENPKWRIDLQEQADIYEAYLQALSGRGWIAGAFSFVYAYWNQVTKAIDVRAKPSERILAKWFGWIRGRFAKIELDKNELTFNSTKQRELLSSQTFQVKNSAEQILKYRVTSSSKWLKLKPRRGKSRGEWDKVTVSIITKKLEKGTHTGVIEVLSSNAFNSPQKVRVKVILR